MKWAKTQHSSALIEQFMYIMIKQVNKRYDFTIYLLFEFILFFFFSLNFVHVPPRICYLFLCSMLYNNNNNNNCYVSFLMHEFLKSHDHGHSAFMHVCERESRFRSLCVEMFKFMIWVFIISYWEQQSKTDFARWP